MALMKRPRKRMERSPGIRIEAQLGTVRGYDKAFCCAHVGVLPCGGMRINDGTRNINAHESRSSLLDLPVRLERW